MGLQPSKPGQSHSTAPDWGEGFFALVVWTACSLLFQSAFERHFPAKANTGPTAHLRVCCNLCAGVSRRATTCSHTILSAHCQHRTRAHTKCLFGQWLVIVW
eukprot:m.325971 g.325971  ORF g.325971 m.325971 type:complete len:102 (-) comp55568_c3_seq8:172-477(-)